MSSDLRDQIYEQMNLKETDDLLDIWVLNDRTEWSDEAFEIIHQIFIKRDVNYPEQDEPIYTREEETPAKKTDRDGLEEWEIQVLDDENQPDFYDTLEVLDLRRILNRTATASIVIYGLSTVFNLPNTLGSMLGKYSFIQEFLGLAPILLGLLAGLGLKIVITYFSLKALGSILRILMEMEFNSRHI